MSRTPRREALLRWMQEHDDRIYTFVAPYLVLSVVLSIFVSLFWLIALIALHAGLEWFRQRKIHPDPALAAGRVLWELKLDIALLLFALAIVLYTEAVLGLLGVGAAARTGAAGAARIVAWQRGIRGVLLTVDEAAIAANAALRLRRRKDDDGEAADDDDAAQTPDVPVEKLRPWKLKWGRGDAASLVLFLLMAALLLAAPALTGGDVQSLVNALLDELHPLP